jgi:hypothetical protein
MAWIEVRVEVYENPIHYYQSSAIRQSESVPIPRGSARAAVTKPKTGARYADPLDYAQHPYDSMKRFAQLLALRYDMLRTRHAYYRGN